MKFPVAPHRSGWASIIARSVHGLEWVLADEVSSVFATDEGVQLGRREVRFEVPEPQPQLLALRTADDVFLEVGVVDRVPSSRRALPELGEAVLRLDWETALRRLTGMGRKPPPESLDVVASVEGKRPYNRYAVETAVGSALSSLLGATFLERGPAGRDGGRSELTVRVFVRNHRAVAAVRLGLDPLHRRAYKQNTGKGTLHPPAAAAMAAIAAPESGVALDPFCGDGTIAIEASLRSPQLTVIASDLDQARVANARRNAARAEVRVRLLRADAGTLAIEAGSVDAVLTNPPWSHAIEWEGSLAQSPRRFWNALPAMLGGSGVLCSLTDADLDLPGMLTRSGWSIALRTQLRLVGRVVHLVLAAPPGRQPPSLPPVLLGWRRRAVREGVVTQEGF